MRLSVKGLMWAAAFGSAILVAVVGILNILFPGYAAEYLKILSAFYPGYKASGNILDLIVGVVYAFVDGLICGVIFAWLYNGFTGKKAAAPRRAAARRSAPKAKKRPVAKKKPAAKKKKAAAKKRKR
jgi:uncharacterized membrane protein YeaQ/YmgE (transglycosylase-associated protein family)